MVRSLSDFCIEFTTVKRELLSTILLGDRPPFYLLTIVVHLSIKYI
jgi:hypothetical protein